MLRICAVALLLACGTSQAPVESIQPPAEEPIDEPPAPPVAAGEGEPERPATPIADQYREVAKKIIAAAEADQDGWKKLAHLTDRIGHRLSGSAALDKAIEWSLAAMKADGHENVRGEKVMVPHWVRGEEWGRITAPVERRLALLQLGGSGATAKKGLSGEVVVVREFEELDVLGAAGVKGKIVLFNHPMRQWNNQKDGPGYGEAAPFRTRGPNRAAKLGAAAALVRSVTAKSLRSPHTGATGFEEGVKPIPAVAISVEDAELIARLTAAGEKVRVQLRTSGKKLKDARSQNVIAEIRGREKPEEVVVIGGHIDSWDVGTGAHDDAGGCVIAMQALTVLRRLGLTPRRTIRVVLFTNEENGLEGAKQYVAAHAAEMKHHVMALEADTGVFAPRGFSVQGDADAVRRATDIVSLLEPIGATTISTGYSGADVGQIVEKGAPGLGLSMDSSTYFDYHHSEADTLDKIRPEDLRRDIATVAVMAYVVADMPDRLGGAPPPDPAKKE
jgi:carboxypeptidase Q